jgi:hypothetical protein
MDRGSAGPRDVRPSMRKSSVWSCEWPGRIRVGDMTELWEQLPIWLQGCGSDGRKYPQHDIPVPSNNSNVRSCCLSLVIFEQATDEVLRLQIIANEMGMWVENHCLFVDDASREIRTSSLVATESSRSYCSEFNFSLRILPTELPK